jgi:hypothetical protein
VDGEALDAVDATDLAEREDGEDLRALVWSFGYWVSSSAGICILTRHLGSKRKSVDCLTNDVRLTQYTAGTSVLFDPDPPCANSYINRPCKRLARPFSLTCITTSI